MNSARGVALVVGIAVAVTVACGPDRPDERTGTTKDRLRTNPALADFAVYASNSVSLMDRAQVQGGDVGVEHAGTGGPFLVMSYEAALAADSRIETTHDLLAEDVFLRDRATVGDVEAAHITNQFGVYAHQYALPPMPTFPSAATAAPGSSPYAVSNGQTQTLTAGAYAAVTVNGTLHLGGGTYDFASLTLGNDARIVAQATTTVHIAGRLSTGDRVHIETSGASLSAKDLRLEISGQNGATGALSATPKAATLGNDTVVRALFLVPNGSLQTGHRTNATGALFARDVLVNLDAHVMFQDGFASEGCGSCDDQNACTTDTCSSGSCTHAPAASGTGCDDHDACTTADTCQNGVCIGSTVVCPAPDACHVAGACDPATGACSSPAKPEGSACGSSACSPNDHCQGGVCVPGPTTTCSASDACHLAGTCNPATGACSNPPAPAGTPCGDSNACTGIGQCDGLGACVVSIPPVVDDGNPCTIDVCDPVFGVIHTPVPSGTTCGNGDRCDGDETCDGAGTCTVGTPPVVDDGNPCTDDTCDPATGVTHTPRPAGDLACNDANACNGLEQCDGAGTCINGPPPNLDDGNVCTLDDCSPVSGPVHVPVPGCDPTPVVGDDRLETRASLMGRLIDESGTGLTGATFTVYDERRVGAPRNDVVVVQGNDGSFRLRLTSFPEEEPPRAPIHRLVVVIELSGRLPAMRVTFARPGEAVPLGSIRLIQRDPTITSIGPSGGVASDSRGLVQVVIPPGALDTTVPVQITPFDSREDFPAPLPHATTTNYGFALEPTGTTFHIPVRVRIVNRLNLPTGLNIPVGAYNEAEGRWDTEGAALWDGERFAFDVTHFSDWDANLSLAGDLILKITRSSNPNRSKPICNTGSSWRVGGGSMNETFPLPSVHSAGEDFGVVLHYDSGLAGSRKLGAAPSSGGGAVPTGSLAVSVASSKATTACVPRGAGDAGPAGATTPGTCTSVIGSCGAGGVQLNVSSLYLLNGLARQVTPPNNATELANGEAWIHIPYAVATSGSEAPLARTSFITTRMTVGSGAATTCASGGGTRAATFGASDVLAPRAQITAQEGPMVDMTRKVLMHHRFTSPFGAGWAIGSASRVYLDGDHAVLVGGDGQEEEFHPRVRLDRAGLTMLANNTAFARDLVTGESFAITQPGAIYRIDPITGTSTQILPSLGFGSGLFHGFAVAYVGGQRRFVIAHQTGLYDVDTGGSLRTLRSKLRPSGIYQRLGLATHGSNAYFTPGDGDADTSVLFKLDLSQSTPTPVAMSLPTGGDISLHPTAQLGGVTFGRPKGIAFSEEGTLYMADSQRHALYAIRPEMSGELGANSTVDLVLGDGAGSQAPPIGEPQPAETFSINQPHHVATAEDGTVFVALSFGVVSFDPQAKMAELLFIDNNQDEIQPSLTNFGSTATPSFLALSKNLMLATTNEGVARVSVDLLSSEQDPTRTLTTDASGLATLKDTTQGIFDRFDRAGRLIEHRRRTGKVLYTVHYVDTQGDAIEDITDGTGGRFTFAYANGKIHHITDPASGVTTFAVDEHGDLIQFREPDGAIHQLAYDAHHLVKKTSPRGDETKYTYADDGTLATTEKPAHETYELHASLSPAMVYNAVGQLEARGSYTDARGVTHVFTTTDNGDIEKETFDADGVAYVREAVVPSTLLDNDAEAFVSRRNNQRIRRVSQWKLNGAPLSPPYSFDSYGRVVVRTPAAEHSGNLYPTTLWAYDANGWLSSETLGGSYVGQFIERDAVGHVARIYDAYDPRRGIGSSPTGHEIVFTWRSDDQPASIKAHDVTTTFTYDGTGNLLRTDNTLGQVTTFEYDPRGNVRAMSDDTATRQFESDTNNRLLRSIDAFGNETTFQYTHASCGCSEGDLVTAIRTPDLGPGEEWGFSYGPEGRIATVTDPHGFTESFTYEPSGELKSVKDRLDRTTTLAHDQLGRVTALLDVAGRKRARVYSVPTTGAWTGPSLAAASADGTTAGVSLTDALRNGDYQIGLHSLDTEGYPAKISFYRDATFELAYTRYFDVALRPTQEFDRVGRALTDLDTHTKGATDGTFEDHQISYHLDTAGPFPIYDSSHTATGGDGSSAFTYNAHFDVTKETGFGGGIEAPVTHIFTRDVGGRLINRTNRFYTGVVTNDPLVMTAPDSHYTYRSDGRLGEIRDAAGVHSFTYDARGLVATQTVGFDGETEGTYVYGYDEVGRNTSLTFPDGHVRAQSYDALGHLVERCYQYPSTSGLPPRCYGASYDAVGNVTELRDPEGTDAVLVDALDRLTTVTRTGPPGEGSSEETYAYNALGALARNAGVELDLHRPRLDGNGIADAAIPLTLGGQPVLWNKGGYVTGLRGSMFDFSTAGYLRTADGVRFAVNTAHQRAWRFGGGPLEAYVYEGPNVVATIRHNDAPLNNDYVAQQWLYDGIDHPVRLRTTIPGVGSKTVYYELDLAGNVRRLRGDHGEDYGGYRYTAFGQTLEDTASSTLESLVPPVEQRLRWKARPRYVFGGTEVYDMRARQWAPELGAFLSIDKYRFHSPRTTLWGWPGQNPIRWRDPSGHDAFGSAIGAGIGGMIGARVGFVLGGGAGLAGIAGGPAVAVTVPTGAFAGAGAGLAAGGLIGAYWGNRIGDKVVGLFNSGGDDDDAPPSSGVRPIPKPEAPAVPQEDVSGITTREQRCSEEATRITDEMERNGCHSDTDLNKAWSDAFASCMQALGESL